jgi:hypothetical protein
MLRTCVRRDTGFTVFGTVALYGSIHWQCGGGIQIQYGPNSGVNQTNAAINKLERIRQLWEELGRTSLHTPEYQAVMKRIRDLSAEYQMLTDASKKPEKSGGVTTPMPDGHPD